jgi:hypothetical protein
MINFNLFYFLLFAVVLMFSGHDSRRPSLDLASFGLHVPTDVAVCWVANHVRFSDALVSLYTVVNLTRSDHFTVACYLFAFEYQLSREQLGQVAFLRSVNPKIAVHVTTVNRTAYGRVMNTTLWRGDHWFLGTASLGRFFVHRWVQAELILYLDADTLLAHDFLSEVRPFLQRFPRRVLYAVLDVGLGGTYLPNQIRKQGIGLDYYVNVGVLLMRNDRELTQMTDRVFECVRFGRGFMVDQDCLNIEAGPTRTGLLPKKFNCHRLAWEPTACHDDNFGSAVVHHGRRMPWTRAFHDELVMRAKHFLSVQKS